MYFLNIKVVIIILIVYTLIKTSEALPQVENKGIKSANDNKFYSIEEICKDYRFEYPPSKHAKHSKHEVTRIKNGTAIDCIWSAGMTSRIINITDCELFTTDGLIKVLWQAGIRLDGENKARAVVKFEVPWDWGNRLPAHFLLRSAASTDFGPHCNAYTDFIETKSFNITEIP
ncbi:12629_t:CDS:2 [Dentiscutata heterogama]|uniref:12629_t:CDS:1 n=1 Tax=Dentiscutata heterogama TaxID=1316150 RepID=A0ACA9JVW5_9GLOM|nr:12629_t:CDS:2 [Dentiscutata heterogama]